MKKVAYFDNAATTYPKPESVYDLLTGFTGNAVLMLEEVSTNLLPKHRHLFRKQES